VISGRGSVVSAQLVTLSFQSEAKFITRRASPKACSGVDARLDFPTNSGLIGDRPLITDTGH